MYVIQASIEAMASFGYGQLDDILKHIIILYFFVLKKVDIFLLKKLSILNEVCEAMAILDPLGDGPFLGNF